MPASDDPLSVHPEGDAFHSLDTLVEPEAPARATRADGWRPARQRTFLEMLAEGHTITNACRALGMSVTSAYTLRRAPRGAAFALGWQAALLLAREHLADKLLERAVHGTVETITRPDGARITRQRHDNRLAMQMLNRLDRLADPAGGAADHAAARLAAAEFGQYLDLVERDGGGARAGLFLARRLDAAAAPDDLAPVRALARADAWLRGHADAAEAVAVADLDPAQRAGWTAEQWARAEAAGLLVLAPPPPPPPPAPEPAPTPQLPKLRERENPDDEPVWWSDDWAEWRTRFPPPADFCGEENGEFGERGYSRQLADAELDVIEGPWRRAVAARRALEEQERDAFFAEEMAALEDEAEDDPPPPLPAAAPLCPRDAGEGSRLAGGVGEGVPGGFPWHVQAQPAGAAAPC